jgi:chromosome segregation ATPase
MNNNEIVSILSAKNGMHSFHTRLGRAANQARIASIINKARRNFSTSRTAANEYKIRTKFVKNYKSALENLKAINAEQRAQLGQLLTQVRKLTPTPRRTANKPPLAPRRTPALSAARTNLRSLMQQQITALTAQRNAINRQIGSIETKLRQMPST